MATTLLLLPGRRMGATALPLLHCGMATRVDSHFLFHLLDARMDPLLLLLLLCVGMEARVDPFLLFLSLARASHLLDFSMASPDLDVRVDGPFLDVGMDSADDDGVERVERAEFDGRGRGRGGEQWRRRRRGSGIQ